MKRWWWVWMFTGWTVAGMAQELFVVPARYSVLQVMFDIVRLRPAGLVSYQGSATSPTIALHAWNGEEWVAISLEAFRDGSFARVRPARIALVGDQDMLPPALVAAAQALAPIVVNWTDLDNAALINAAGQWLKFTSREWQWMAARYNMSLTDIHEPLRRDSWYYHPHTELRRGPVIPLRVQKTYAPPPAPVVPVTGPSKEPAAAKPGAPTNAAPAAPAPQPAPRVVPAATNLPPPAAPNAMWEPPELAPPPLRKNPADK